MSASKGRVANSHSSKKQSGTGQNQILMKSPNPRLKNLVPIGSVTPTKQRSKTPVQFHWKKHVDSTSSQEESDSDGDCAKSSPKTYHVLSQPVRLELNKYFYEVNESPSKKERKLLLHSLWNIDVTVSYAKLVKWFQNKRHYEKTHFRAEERARLTGIRVSTDD